MSPHSVLEHMEGYKCSQLLRERLRIRQVWGGGEKEDQDFNFEQVAFEMSIRYSSEEAEYAV